MNKKLLFLPALAMGMALVSVACSDDDEPEKKVDAANIDYQQQNAQSWHNYMTEVAKLLRNDASSLADSWTESYNGGEAYASLFKAHAGGDYTSAASCVEQIIDGCIDIASEVGTAKIGEPYDLYVSGKTTEALYAVESWYSWHSRDDYRNNIFSIRNAYYGSLNGTVSPMSISAAIKAANADLDAKVIAAIDAAAAAIYAIPQPFRNNIDSREASDAMDACAALENILDNELKPVATKLDDALLDAIVANYVDVVVVPTYTCLKTKAADLYNAVVAIAQSPSNDAFKAACDAWLSAREPWEMSEAFLFGPVDALGLDPNMDSWPLDQAGIVQLLNSGKWDAISWADGDSDEAVEQAQSLRGFHTLEFLLFKDGEPRKVK